jgi:tetratricopeptide (TPR) repeat protein
MKRFHDLANRAIHRFSLLGDNFSGWKEMVGMPLARRFREWVSARVEAGRYFIGWVWHMVRLVQGDILTWDTAAWVELFPITAVVWLITRPYQLLWRALPAMLAVITVLAVAVACMFPQGQGNYQAVVNQALSKKDYATVRVASLRQMQLGGNQPPYLFNLAQSLDGLGQPGEAQVLMRMVAPLSRPGHAPAHLYAARALLVRTNLSPAECARAETHLSHVLTLNPTSLEANDILGSMYAEMHCWDLAKKHLAMASAGNPFSAVSLAALLMDQGDPEGARKYAAVARHLFLAWFAHDDRPTVGLAWIKSLALEDDFPGALGMLQRRREHFTKTAYAVATGDLYLMWANFIQRTQPGDLTTLIQLLKTGLEAAPKNVGLLGILGRICEHNETATPAQRAFLENLLAKGEAPELLHYILGMAAWDRSELEAARRHFQLACAASPPTAIVVNNLAYLMVMGPNPDPPRALAMINPLVEQFPKAGNYRDTRGQILVKLGRWQEAITDLEQALPQLPRKGQTHGALAIAYRELGMPKLAAQHAQMAKPTLLTQPKLPSP